VLQPTNHAHECMAIGICACNLEAATGEAQGSFDVKAGALRSLGLHWHREQTFARLARRSAMGQ
jgi:hypothetical protein